MAGARAPIRFRPAILVAALVAGYVASVLFSIFLGRTGGPTPSIWTATGFLTGALILLQGRWRVAAAALCLGFQAAVSFAVGDGLARALTGPPVDLLEAGLAAWLAVTFCGARRRRLSLRDLTLLMLAAIAPAAAIGALPGAGINFALRGQGLFDGWLAWAVPSGLGMAIVTPTLLLLSREEQFKEFRRSHVETGGLLGGVCGLTAAAFFQNELPLQFVIFPSLTLVAFRLGPPGAAVAGVFVAAICLSLATLGHGLAPPALSQLGRIRLTQVVVTAAFCGALATAVIVAEQARLRRLLVSRDRAVRAALLRARRAERIVVAAVESGLAAPARKAG